MNIEELLQKPESLNEIEDLEVLHDLLKELEPYEIITRQIRKKLWDIHENEKSEQKQSKTQEKPLDNFEMLGQMLGKFFGASENQTSKQGQSKKQEKSIKNFEILETLLTELGDSFKYVIMDLDRVLTYVGKAGYWYFSGIELDNIFIKNNLDSSKYHKEIEKILNFLIENNILIQVYSYKCPNCNEEIFTITGKPTEDDLKKEIEVLFDKVEDFCCNECNKSLKIKLEDVSPTIYFEKNYFKKIEWVKY